MDLSKFRGLKFGDLGERRQHEPGWYEGRFVQYEGSEFESKNGTVMNVTLLFVAEAPVEGQDMRGVNTNRRLRKKITLWDDDSTADVTAAIQKLDPNIGTPSESNSKEAEVVALFENYINTSVLVKVGGDKDFAKKNDNKYMPIILDFKVRA